MMRLPLLLMFGVLLGLTSTPAPAKLDQACVYGCKGSSAVQGEEEYRACMASCWRGWSPDAADDTDPFLCRFGEMEAGAPVLLAATRQDCTRAGGAVMTPADPDRAARE